MAKTKQIELKEEKKDINTETLKEELKEYIDLEIKKEYQEEINKINNKLIKEKNKKIIFRNIIILLLIAIIGFLLYLLYDNNYFSKILVKDNDIKEIKKEEDNTKKEDDIKIDDKEKDEIKKPSLTELKDKYGHLIDKYYISDTSKYLDDYYKGNLTSELKSYLTLNNINFNDLEIDDNSNIISEAEFKEIYESLFIDKYEGLNFDYNGNKIRFLSKISSYITEKELQKEKSNIVREIISIEENENKILITCVEGKIIDNKLYNIISGEEITDYSGKITDYKDKLNNVTYVFANNKLTSFSK